MLWQHRMEEALGRLEDNHIQLRREQVQLVQLENQQCIQLRRHRRNVRERIRMNRLRVALRHLEAVLPQFGRQGTLSWKGVIELAIFYIYILNRMLAE